MDRQNKDTVMDKTAQCIFLTLTGIYLDNYFLFTRGTWFTQFTPFGGKEKV